VNVWKPPQHQKLRRCEKINGFPRCHGITLLERATQTLAWTCHPRRHCPPSQSRLHVRGWRRLHKFIRRLIASCSSSLSAREGDRQAPKLIEPTNSSPTPAIAAGCQLSCQIPQLAQPGGDFGKLLCLFLLLFLTVGEMHVDTLWPIDRRCNSSTPKDFLDLIIVWFADLRVNGCKRLLSLARMG
jgi:hypothetical protein